MMDASAFQGMFGMMAPNPNGGQNQLAQLLGLLPALTLGGDQGQKPPGKMAPPPAEMTPPGGPGQAPQQRSPFGGILSPEMLKELFSSQSPFLTANLLK